jgi:hypothetical protein
MGYIYPPRLGFPGAHETRDPNGSAPLMGSRVSQFLDETGYIVMRLSIDHGVIHMPEAFETPAEEVRTGHDDGLTAARSLDSPATPTAAVPEDPSNPHPSTWQTDESGNVVKAGDVFQATYGPDGQLQKAVLGDDTWEMTAPGQIAHTYKTNTGEFATETINDVRSFTATPSHNDFHGPVSSMDIDVQFGTGSSHSQSSKVYESPEHTAYVTEYWRQKREREAAGEAGVLDFN